MKQTLKYLCLGFLIGYCISTTYLVSLLMLENNKIEKHSKELSVNYSESLLRMNTLECELRKAGVYIE